MEETKANRVYKITSANTPLFFVGSTSNPKAYLSQIIHNYIRQYNDFVLHNKKYKTCFFVIHSNDVSIEPINSYDHWGDMKYAIDDIISINNKYDMEIAEKVLRPIRTTLKQNKQTKEEKQQYFKEYYLKHKESFIKPEQQKLYYENNKQKVSERNKARYEKMKLDKNPIKL